MKIHSVKGGAGASICTCVNTETGVEFLFHLFTDGHKTTSAGQSNLRARLKTTHK